MSDPHDDAQSEQPGDVSDDHAAAIAGLSRDDLAAVLGFAEEGETAPEETGNEEPSGEQRDGAGAAGYDRPRDRISLRSLPDDQKRQFAEAADLIRNGMAADLHEALRILNPDTARASEQQAETTPYRETAADALDVLQDELRDLREQRAEADDSFDRARARELTDAIEDKVGEIAQARAAAKFSEQQNASHYDSGFNAACDEMEQRYPEAADETSAFYQVLKDRVDAMAARNDPSMSDPSFILRAADEVAEILGPRARGQALARPANRPPAKPAARPAGSTVAPASTANRMTRNQVDHAIANASPDVLGAALGWS